MLIQVGTGMDLSDPRLCDSADQLGRYEPWELHLGAAMVATSRDEDEREYWLGVMVLLLARARQGLPV